MKTTTKKEFFEKLGRFILISKNEKNLTVLTFEKGSAIFSYNQLVYGFVGGIDYYTEKHDYSYTTCKQLHRELYNTSKQRNEALKNEIAILIK